ncbi:DUF934 domain-containing protein [Paracoccus jiaweipingae]|uniref:DUF934 domain-containing protein n=1 Tax=unclassified Paracoccus (in: a-proteobacteria) TaxID=2688777 RepID=UPI0037AA0C19
MSVIVTDTGFAPDDWQLGWGSDGAGVDLAADTDPDALDPALMQAPAIRIPFAAFSDGRGFTLARSLRRAGYAGRLRAAGHVLADQYAMARRTGFDEVEISADLAARQPQDQWLARADWRAHDYQARLRGAG